MAVDFSLLQPVDIGGQMMQGFQTGRAFVKQIQAENALRAYTKNPDDPEAFNALAAFNPQMAHYISQARTSQLKAQSELEERRAMRTLGAQAAGGDIAGASKAALGMGEFDLADKIMKLGPDQRTKAADFFKTAAPLAFRMKQMKDPAQRQAYFEDAKPILLAKGADPNLLAQFDVTNDRLLDIYASGERTVDQLIDAGKIDYRQLGPGARFEPFSAETGAYVGASSSVYRPPGAAPSADVAPMESAVAQTLSQANLPGPVVAGFLGNLSVEAGYGGAKGDGGAAHGIAQWRGERQANFQRVIGKPIAQASPGEQAKFIVWEMQNPEAAGMTVDQRDAILSASTPAEAAALIDQHYERSDGQHRSRRMEAANRYAGMAGPSPDAAVGGGDEPNYPGADALRAPVRVSSKAEVDALPSGTRFIAPNGSVKVKP